LTPAGQQPTTKQPPSLPNIAQQANVPTPTTATLRIITVHNPQHVLPMYYGSTAFSAAVGIEYDSLSMSINLSLTNSGLWMRVPKPRHQRL
jgi:hypothetical protein